MSIIDPIKEFLFRLMFKKGVVSAAKLIVSFALAHGIKLIVPVKDITINVTDEAAMVVAINSGLTMLRNWLKTKWPGKFGFL